jgi:hypothetical protein
MLDPDPDRMNTEPKLWYKPPDRQDPALDQSSCSTETYMAELRGWSCYLQEDGAAGQDAQLAQVQVILPQVFAVQKEDLIVGRHFEYLHDLQH